MTIWPPPPPAYDGTLTVWATPLPKRHITSGGDWMVGPLWVLSYHFGPPLDRGAETAPPCWGDETLVQYPMSPANPRYPLAPTIAKIRYTCYALWRQNLSHNSLPCQILSVSSEELALPRLIRCELSRLHCYGHSLLLSSYLCRIKQKKNSSWSTCGQSLYGIWLTSSWIVLHPNFPDASSLALLPFWPLIRNMGRGPTVGFPWSSSTPPFLRRGLVAPPPSVINDIWTNLSGFVLFNVVLQITSLF